jgi:translation initiation factor 4G
MCKLFIIVGRDLDMLSSDSRKQMEEYFRALKAIMNNKSLPSRIRFLVLDVVEFRQAGWAPKTAKAGK